MHLSLGRRRLAVRAEAEPLPSRMVWRQGGRPVRFGRPVSVCRSDRGNSPVDTGGRHGNLAQFVDDPALKIGDGPAADADVIVRLTYVPAVDGSQHLPEPGGVLPRLPQ